jgi:hypothetical protein
MPSTGRSLLGALLACGLALSQAARSEHPALPDRVSDPILGLALNWNRLPRYETPVLGEPEGIDRRELARVAAGRHQLVLVLSLVPIHADAEDDAAPLGYEVDSGQLLKHFGNFASPLGASSGDLSEDFPELRVKLVAELLDNYLSALGLQYPDYTDLLEQIEASPICASFDDRVLWALDSKSLAPRKCTAPAVDHGDSSRTRNSDAAAQAQSTHPASTPSNEAGDSQ